MSYLDDAESVFPIDIDYADDYDVDELDELMHYGTKYHSGRYPWGSGEDPYQRSGDLLSRVDQLKQEGFTEPEIAKAMGIVNDKGEPSTTRLRIQISLATNERRANMVATAKSLRADGLNYSEIGRRMGINESTVRSLLNSDSEARMFAAQKTANFLKEQVDTVGMIDVGKGVEKNLGVSQGRLANALYILKTEGYEVYEGRVPQVNNPGKQTTIKVLCPPGTAHKEIYDYSNVHQIQDKYISYDNGQTFKPAFVYPKSMDSKRLAICYKEDGGAEKDGLIEIRRGVDDLSLGNSHYAQVRILVDDTHYLKGMAVYADDLPEGVDVRFNTNKTKAINATKDAVSSGWSQTFETIFGNYEEAKVLWTDVANELYDIFATSAEGRNELLAQWKELGGRDLMVESLMNALQILKNLMSSVSEAFHDIFPPMTAERLLGISQSIRDFTDRLKNNEGLFNNLQRIFRGFFAILGLGKTIITSLFRALEPLLSKLSALGGGLMGVTGTVGDFIYKINNAAKESDIFYKIFSKIVGIILKVISVFASLINKIRESTVFASISALIMKAFQALKRFIGAAKEKFATPGFSLLHAILEKIWMILTKIGNAILKVASFFINAFKSVGQALAGSSFLEVMGKLWEIIVAVGKCIFGLLGKAISYLCDKLKDADFKGILDLLSTISVGGMALGITKFVKNISEPFKGLKDILDGVSGILDGVRGCFEAYQKKLKADALMKIATAIAILVASLLVLSFIDNEKLMSGVATIAMLFTELMVAMKILNGIGGKGVKTMKLMGMMLGLSIAVLILVSALKKLSALDPAALLKGLLGVGALVTIIVA